MNRFAPPGTRNGGGVAARSPIRWALSRTKTRRTMPESTLGSVSRTSPQTRHVSDPRSYWFPQHRQLSVTTGSSHRATCRGRRIRPLPAAGALVTGLAPQTARPTNTTTARIIVSLTRVTSMSRRPGFAARRTLRPLSTAIGCPSVALPGPSARTATMRPRAAGSSGSTYTKLRQRLDAEAQRLAERPVHRSPPGHRRPPPRGLCTNPRHGARRTASGGAPPWPTNEEWLP